MFSSENRCIYRFNQLGEVICQLRFPEILTISANLPVQFQEAIRQEFPRYQLRQEPDLATESALEYEGVMVETGRLTDGGLSPMTALPVGMGPAPRP